jgi:methyltransferase (TIGR00027 family)
MPFNLAAWGKWDMKANRRSMTADWSAAIRAGHLRYDRPVIFEDKLALGLTSSGWRFAVRAWPLFPLALHYLGIKSFRGNFLIRQRYTEDKLDVAIRNGIEQYVILGAGLDSFAWRRPDVAGRLTVFEVDHPDSQAAKSRRIKELGLPIPDHLEFVATDFGKESVAEALARSRYRPDRRTFFAMLGTVQYLSRDTLAATLRSIADSTAPGSELVVSYHAVDPANRDWFERGARAAARRSEPFVSLYDPAEFPRVVCGLGYELVENFSPQDQEQRYLAGRTDALQASKLSLGYLAHFRVRKGDGAAGNKAA